MQWLAHSAHNRRVVGSSPTRPTNDKILRLDKLQIIETLVSDNPISLLASVKIIVEEIIRERRTTPTKGKVELLQVVSS